MLSPCPPPHSPRHNPLQGLPYTPPMPSIHTSATCSPHALPYTFLYALLTPSFTHSVISQPSSGPSSHPKMPTPVPKPRCQGRCGSGVLGGTAAWGWRLPGTCLSSSCVHSNILQPKVQPRGATVASGPQGTLSPVRVHDCRALHLMGLPTVEASRLPSSSRSGGVPLGTGGRGPGSGTPWLLHCVSAALRPRGFSPRRSLHPFFQLIGSWWTPRDQNQ